MRVICKSQGGSLKTSAGGSRNVKFSAVASEIVRRPQNAALIINCKINYFGTGRRADGLCGAKCRRTSTPIRRCPPHSRRSGCALSALEHKLNEREACFRCRRSEETERVASLLLIGVPTFPFNSPSFRKEFYFGHFSCYIS